MPRRGHRGRARTWRWPPASRPTRLVLHGNNKSEAELARALASGVGRIVVDSFDEIAPLGRLTDEPSDRRPAGPGPGHPGGRGPHPRVRPHRPGGHEVRLLGGLGCGSGGGGRTRALARRGAGGGARPHRQPGVRRRPLRAGGRRSSASSSPPSGCAELVVGGGLGVAYVNGERAPGQAEWAAAAREACSVAGVDPATRITAEPGRSIVATAGITLYRVGTIKELPGIRTYVAVDGGMSDNPRPVLYGSGYEAFLPREVGASRPRGVRVVGKHCESGDVVVANAHLPADLARGRRARHPGHRCLRLLDGLQLQQGHPAAGALRVWRTGQGGGPGRDS